MRAWGIAALLVLFAGCSHGPTRSHARRSEADGTEGPRRAAPRADAYEVLARTRVSFGRHELATTRTRALFFVEERARHGLGLRARVFRLSDDEGTASAFSDVEVSVDRRGGLSNDPLSLCDDPDVDDLSPTRIVRQILGTIAPWDGGLDGSVVLDVSEIEAPVELRYAREDGELRATGSGSVRLGSFSVAGWRLRSDGDAHVRVEERLDDDDALVARIRTTVEVVATVTDVSGRSRNGIVEIRSDVVSRPSAETAGAPETCAAGFSREAVAAAVASRADEVQRCYERGLSSDPELHGRLRMAMTVLPLGEVSGVRVVSDELASETVSDCVAEVLRAMRFVEGPVTAIEFELPFSFAPAHAER